MVGGRGVAAALLGGLLLAGAAGLACPPQAYADGGEPTVRVINVESRFPDSVLFSLEASSPVGAVRELNLLVRQGGDRSESVLRVPITPGGSVAAQFPVPSRGMPAGLTLYYRAEAVDDRGLRTVTDAASFWYTDPRQQWSQLTDGTITVHHYGAAGARLAQRVLAGAEDALGNTGRMLGVEMRPFDIMVYNTEADARGAQTPSQNIDGVRSVAYGDLGVVHVVYGPGGSSIEDDARHEVTHMFVRWATLEGVPAWLNEGLAVWAERDAGELFQRAWQFQVARGVPVLRTLLAFPRERESNFFAYVQASSVVGYLIERYGADKFGELVRSLGQGEDRALQQVYGLTLDGLDAAWRSAKGLPPADYTRALPTPLPVFGAPEPPEPAPPPPSAAAAAAAGLEPLLAGAAGLALAGAGWSLARRRR